MGGVTTSPSRPGGRSSIASSASTSVPGDRRHGTGRWSSLVSGVGVRSLSRRHATGLLAAAIALAGLPVPAEGAAAVPSVRKKPLNAATQASRRPVPARSLACSSVKARLPPRNPRWRSRRVLRPAAVPLASAPPPQRRRCARKDRPSVPPPRARRLALARAHDPAAESPCRSREGAAMPARSGGQRAMIEGIAWSC